MWIDADGGSTTLEVQWDVSGRFAPKPSFEEDGVPGQPGMRFRAVRHELREFVLLVDVVGSSESDLRTQVRDLVAKMDPTRGPGKVRITAPGGDQREISCFYAAGLDLDEKLGSSSGLYSESAPIVFRAHDPYWYAISDVVADFAIETAPVFFPIFPLRLTASEIAVDTTVTNSGDVETWPVWTITGPGSGIALHNLTTGKAITMPGVTLTNGESIEIDTRPGAKTVLRNDGTNMWPYLSTTSSLWPLVRGSNAVRLEMTGAVVGVSKLRISHRPRYLSP